MGRPWTRADWNALIGKINAFSASECFIGEPLEEVTERHIWKVSDITKVRDKLTQICANAPVFSAATTKWTRSIIDELESAIESCSCCPVATVAIPTQYHAFQSRVFETAEAMSANAAAALNNEAEGVAASSVAADERTTLETLLSDGGSEQAVEAQVASLNLAASVAWSYISSANTERYDLSPLGPLLSTSYNHTSTPTLRHFEFNGKRYKNWAWCESTARIRTVNYGCWGSSSNLSSIEYADEFLFNGAPNGTWFLAGTPSSTSIKMFFRNWYRGCATDFTGDGDCDSVAACLNYLNSAGLRHAIAVEYGTASVSKGAWEDTE